MAYGFNDDKSKVNLSDLLLFIPMELDSEIDIDTGESAYASFSAESPYNDPSEYKFISIIGIIPSVVKRGTTTIKDGSAVISSITASTYYDNSVAICFSNVSEDNITLTDHSLIKVAMMKV